MTLPDVWQTHIAKAKFSQLIKAVRERGDQIISVRGEQVAVIISKKRYDKLTKPSDSFLEFFKNAPLQDIELEIERNHDLLI